MELKPDFNRFLAAVRHRETGFCLGSGNSVPAWAKFDNYMAMRDGVLKYGTYPIRI